MTNPAFRPSLAQRIGLYTATMIVVGSMVGSGIFKKPAVMAAQLGSPGLLLAMWVAAGLITLFGALTNAEIAGMITAVGGQYVFFRRIYNNFVGYLYGWAVFAVIQTGSIASIAYVCAEYLEYFIPLPRLPPAWEQVGLHLFGVIDIMPFAQIGVKLVTVTLIALLTWVNVRGVTLGAVVQDLFTTMKLLAIAGIVVLAYALGARYGGSASAPAQAVAHGGGSMLGAITMALSGAFWAYDGWNNVTYVAGEVRRANRTIPLALGLGTLTVITLYLGVNAAYLHLLPIDEMARSSLVAADAMQRALGPIGGALVALLVIGSTFGTTNGTILASSRVYFAMAEDGLFFSSAGRVHPRYGTPAASLLIQGLWAGALVFSGTFDQLTDMLIFVSWIFYAAGALGVFVLRRREPEAERPYRVWGYPWVPALFVLVASIYVIVTLWTDPRNALLGLLLCAAGVPLYRRWQRRERLSAGTNHRGGPN